MPKVTALIPSAGSGAVICHGEESIPTDHGVQLRPKLEVRPLIAWAGVYDPDADASEIHGFVIDHAEPTDVTEVPGFVGYVQAGQRVADEIQARAASWIGEQRGKVGA